MGKNSNLRYSEIRIKIKELVVKNQLLPNVKLNCSEVVIDADKFVEGHLYYLDGIKAKEDQGKKINRRLVAPFVNRLNQYYRIVSNK